jgi:2-polyprenyl-6-methoxyphenol hydroxylase-like FAD-dependent oxidoreductase
MRQTTVLIIGAGPAGLIMSIELTLQGIPHIIIEASASRSPWSRALVLHSRTLELLSRHDGLVEKLLPLGRMNMAVRMFANKSLMFEFDVEDFEMKDTRFVYSLNNIISH